MAAPVIQRSLTSRPDQFHFGLHEQVIDQPRRERLLAAERLLQAAAVEGAHEGRQQQTRDGALPAWRG